jgi:endonuclease YncB( thermonuclease family)
MPPESCHVAHDRHCHPCQSLVGQLGHALAHRQYGGDAYDAEEEEAKTAKRGVWVRPFTAPWDRRKHQAEPESEGPGG